MTPAPLFQARNGTTVSNLDLLRGLESVRAHEAKYLFIHTDLSFGIPDPATRKRELLETLVEIIQQLGVPTICVPTFTFSFCNGDDYDVAKSRSKMGVLNEYIRALPGAVRSRDPLMSVAAMGADLSVVADIGRNSIGEGSTFDLLRKKGGAKFLFLGARPAKCMTYVHYVEERIGVPYRYNRDFTGHISDSFGTTLETYTLFVRYRGVIPSPRDDLERLLLERGVMNRAACGDGFVFAVDEQSVFETAAEMIEKDIDYLLAEPYPRGAKDTSFEAHDMVAL